MFNPTKDKICVVGLGYVGLPLAVLLSKKFKVVGYDTKKERIEELKSGIDSTGEVPPEKLKSSTLEFSHDEKVISECKVIIVAVPTPVDKLKNPDLSFLRSASQVVGRNMQKGSVVVYESTVYPGATEEVCIPILEKESSLKWKRDFWVGYSPERVNPGDREHTLEKVVKVVAGDTPQTAELLSQIYGSVIEAGVYVAPDIRTAEAAKVIENIQRDVNIALINELALIFHRLGLDTHEVLKAASTKWNFLRFEPGLVGGHCIPVDPYYLAHKSQEVGYVPKLILAGRSVNEDIPIYIAHQVVKLLIKAGKKVKGSKLLVLGLSFKENVPDTRNSKVFPLCKELEEFGCDVFVYDPVAERELEESVNRIEDPIKYSPYDAVIFAVRHRVLLEEFTPDRIRSISTEPYILVDIKGIFSRKDVDGFVYWRL
ncbi:UDP-N-acetyl-D-galactosamine dehydrogenase [Thermocrinis minervae]|uniref:UDP-N-acetyl-D-galactosamine dehydrogenase n=2 Tax=Thermocrinis minervae TaxID=381751 RepID=A0A1M6TC78_9AQUI|nr:UDP-N-acetyl-D-galactosamine dehydrogenase [Thermocrinis minervae]